MDIDSFGQSQGGEESRGGHTASRARRESSVAGGRKRVGEQELESFGIKSGEVSLFLLFITLEPRVE
jgi:hypothetical protein